MRKQLTALLTALILVVSALLFVSENAVTYRFVVLDETEEAVSLSLLADNEEFFRRNFEADTVDFLPGPTQEFEVDLADNFNLEVKAEPLNDAIVDIEDQNGVYILIHLRGDAVFVEQSEQPFLLQ